MQASGASARWAGYCPSLGWKIQICHTLKKKPANDMAGPLLINAIVSADALLARDFHPVAIFDDRDNHFIGTLVVSCGVGHSVT